MKFQYDVQYYRKWLSDHMKYGMKLNLTDYMALLSHEIHYGIQSDQLHGFNIT